MCAPDMEAPCAAPPPSRLEVSREAGPVAEARQEHYAGVQSRAQSDLIWEGTTWDACPTAVACCAPLCCMATHWRVTRHAIDMVCPLTSRY